jgi:hypothetical protein
LYFIVNLKPDCPDQRFVSRPALDFSSGARSALKANGKIYLKHRLTRRHLQGFVGCPLKRTIQLKIFGFEAGVLCQPRQHLRPNLVLS